MSHWSLLDIVHNRGGIYPILAAEHRRRSRLGQVCCRNSTITAKGHIPLASRVEVEVGGRILASCIFLLRAPIESLWRPRAVAQRGKWAAMRARGVSFLNGVLDSDPRVIWVCICPLI